jgi:hypothetical protein
MSGDNATYQTTFHEAEITKARNDWTKDKNGSHGWSTSLHEIPQPTSMIMGPNLRQNLPERSEPSKKEKGEEEQKLARRARGVIFLWSWHRAKAHLFGTHVAKIVEASKDSLADTSSGESKPPWRQRKGAYIDHLSRVDRMFCRYRLLTKSTTRDRSFVT